LAPFALGNSADKLKTVLPGAGLETERAIMPAGRQKILDTADHLPVIGGRSCNRRIKTELPDERPRRKVYRRRQNRAIVYLLIETGMRQAGVVQLNEGDIEFARRAVSATEKGGNQQATTRAPHFTSSPLVTPLCGVTHPETRQTDYPRKVNG
jgi:integrase